MLAPQPGEGALRTEQGVAGLRATAAGCLSPAGQLQVATALDVLEALEAGCTRYGTSCWTRPGT